MSSPFYQPARQSFSSSQSMQQPQGGFGVQTAGTFGGFQPQTNFSGNVFGGGFGGGFQPQQQSFGGFGGGQGFGGFNPFQGGFGGFQQQQQFNPYQSGYGGGFNPYQGGFQPQQQQFNPYQGSYGGMPQQGFNPMFGGIGGLGFNPIMGPQFGMPMQGFNPYQIQMMDKQRQFEQQQFNADQTPVMGDMMYRGGPQMLPEMQQALARQQENMLAQQPGLGGLGGGPGQHDRINNPFTGPQRSAQDILSMAVGNTPKDMQYDMNKDGKITSADALAYQRQYGQQPAQQPQSPNQSLDTFRNAAVQAQQQNPAYAQLQELRKQFGGNQAPTQEQLQQLHSLQRQIENDPAVRSAQNRYETNARQHQTEDIRRRMQGELPQPMYGGIGGLGFNPMMGPQFGMPMSYAYQQAMQRGTFGPQQTTPDMSKMGDLERDFFDRRAKSGRTQSSFNPFDESGWAAERERSGRENMRRMSQGQRQDLQSTLEQMQNFGMNSPQMRAMLG